MREHVDKSYAAYLEVPKGASEEMAAAIVIAAAILKASEDITGSIEILARVIHKKEEET